MFFGFLMSKGSVRHVIARGWWNRDNTGMYLLGKLSICMPISKCCIMQNVHFDELIGQSGPAFLAPRY